MNNASLSPNRSLPRRGRAVSVLAWRLAVPAVLGALAASCVVSEGGSAGGDSTGDSTSDECKGGITSVVYAERLIAPSDPQTGLVGQCLPFELTADEKKEVPCIIIEARAVPEDQKAACNACGAEARATIAPYRQSEVDGIQEDYPDEGYNCFCEIQQLAALDPSTADPIAPCLSNTAETLVDQNGEHVDGFCYLGGTAHIGNPELLSQCPSDEQQMLRFVGGGKPTPDSSIFITCTGSEYRPPPPWCTNTP